MRQNPAVPFMGVLTGLEAGMAELSTPMRVYVAAGRFVEVEPDLPELAARIRTLLAGVAVDDLVWPSHRHLPIEAAERAADRVVSLLGPEAGWWTNHDTGCGAVNGLTPLRDSLLAGTDGEHFALALQIADD